MGSPTLHAGPTEPELPLEELLLDELVEPLDPLEPELPDDPELPLDPLELELEPVSGVVAESAAVVPLSSVPGVLAGSVVVLAPASGVGSTDFVSSTVLPSPSSGEVAHAEARATSDSAATAMRVERRMAGTLAAELCTLPDAHESETLR